MWGMVMWADISPTAPAGRVAALCGTAHIGGCSPREGALLRSPPGRCSAPQTHRDPAGSGAQTQRHSPAPGQALGWHLGSDVPWDTAGELE